MGEAERKRNKATTYLPPHPLDFQKYHVHISSKNSAVFCNASGSPFNFSNNKLMNADPSFGYAWMPLPRMHAPSAPRLFKIHHTFCAHC